MPKIYNTRKQRAEVLLERLRRGPASIGENIEQKRMYDLWVNSWIIEEVIDLIPELKAKDKK